MSKLRLFIAIALPDPLKEELLQLQQKLKPFARDAKWVNVNGIHLTLKFLGYVEEEKVTSIESSLQNVKTVDPVGIEAKNCGFFPNARRPNVLWVGVDATGLEALQKHVEAEMTRIGFEKENRAFSPHLTLARFKDSRGLLPLAREVEKLSGKSFGRFTAQGFVLYESILRPQGAEYHKRREFLL